MGANPPALDEVQVLGAEMRALLAGAPPTDRPAPGPSARRRRLAELDALTDRLDPLLAHLDDVWRGVEHELGRRP